MHRFAYFYYIHTHYSILYSPILRFIFFMFLTTISSQTTPRVRRVRRNAYNDLADMLLRLEVAQCLRILLERKYLVNDRSHLRTGDEPIHFLEPICIVNISSRTWVRLGDVVRGRCLGDERETSQDGNIQRTRPNEHSSQLDSFEEGLC